MLSTRERLFQAVLFELLLIALIAPIVYWLGAAGAPVAPEKALVTSVVGSLIALLMNYFYNIAFDRLFGYVRIERSLSTRTLHAIGFEFCIVVAYLPFLMWYLSISLLQALLLDLALMGTALVYTYLFHWVYDHLRHRYFE